MYNQRRSLPNCLKDGNLPKPHVRLFLGDKEKEKQTNELPAELWRGTRSQEMKTLGVLGE